MIKMYDRIMDKKLSGIKTCEQIRLSKGCGIETSSKRRKTEKKSKC